jgi:colicin import membrane protein
MTKPLALRVCVLCALLAAACEKDQGKAPAAPAEAAEPAAEAKRKQPADLDEAMRRTAEAAERARRAGNDAVNSALEHAADGEAELAKARAAADEAAKLAAEATEKLQQLEKDAAETAAKLDELLAALDAAQSSADRDAAKAKLEALQRQHREMQAQIQAAKTAAARAERLKGTKISKECLENPLAKGCQ